MGAQNQSWEYPSDTGELGYDGPLFDIFLHNIDQNIVW